MTRESAASVSIDQRTRMGAVALTISDLGAARDMYTRAVGLRALDEDDGTLRLGTDRGDVLVEVFADPSAPPLDRRATGLFHLAILLPSRADLAAALVRLRQADWSLTGASDHLVSEALYLSDPDGNGIELYRDRPREQWPRVGEQIEMATLPLDLEDLLSEAQAGDEVPCAIPAGTTMGHVHLQVADLHTSEAFYAGVLGFEVTVRDYPGALFVSAGGYHHHLGMNTWHSAGASPPPPGAVGLRSFEVVVPGREDLEAVRRRIVDAGLDAQVDGEATLVRDPSGNLVRLRAEAGS